MNPSIVAKSWILLVALIMGALSVGVLGVGTPARGQDAAPLPSTEFDPVDNPNIAPPPEITESEGESGQLEPADFVPWRSGSALARVQKSYFLGAGIGYDTGTALHVLAGVKIVTDLWAELYAANSTIGFFGRANKEELRLKYFLGQSFNLIGGVGRREIHLRGIEKYNGDPINYKGTDLGFVYGFGNHWYFAQGFSIALEWYDGFSPVKRRLSDEDYERNFMNKSIYTSVFKFTFIGKTW